MVTESTGAAVSRVAVTGASGFLGSRLVSRLRLEGIKARAVVRQLATRPIVCEAGVECFDAPDLAARSDWVHVFEGCDAVIHAAAAVHVMESASASLSQHFHRVNCEGTLNLARQAALAGVRRFVFVSTIKVNGEYTPVGRAFTEQDIPAPIGSYAESKYAAEKGLQELQSASGLEVTIVRPPLVYGPGVRANFLRLVRLIDRRVPLPLSAIVNARSMIGVDNLSDFLVACAKHERAANQTFLVSDREDVSTPDLLRRIGSALGRPARLFPLSPAILRGAALLLGRRNEFERLVESLQVDCSCACAALGWSPQKSVDSGLRDVAEWYRSSLVSER